MTIKAIETEYAGHRFRSRLEARWAVFFDAAGIKWQYEPQGFEDTETGFRYLPDFYLPKLNGGVYFEVKGEKPDEEYVHSATGVTPRPLVFAVGDISSADLWWFDLDTVGNMDQCRSVKFAIPNSLVDLGRSTPSGLTPDAAFRKAQQARFEHGETPKPDAPAPSLVGLWDPWSEPPVPPPLFQESRRS